MSEARGLLTSAWVSAEMEKWFERAMIAKSDNYEACVAKLNWLANTVNGTHKSIVNFGRVCRDTKNWPSRIPLLLAEAQCRSLEKLTATQRATVVTEGKA